MIRLKYILPACILIFMAIGCESGSADSGDYMSGLRDGCTQMGGLWDPNTEACMSGDHWLMVQQSETVSFEFDETMDQDCVSEAFWSGALTMTGASSRTLMFTDRPVRLAINVATEDFVSEFARTFSQETGGNPNAVLSWHDARTGRPQNAVMELRSIHSISPRYDAETGLLVYSVCGLQLNDPQTLAPLPVDGQTQPQVNPSPEGGIQLFIDPGTGSLTQLIAVGQHETHIIDNPDIAF